MATFWAFKTLNSALWTTSTIWGWGHWMFWGNPESAELRMAKQNKERLDKMESKIDQMWAINAGMSPILPMTESLVIVNQDQTTHHKHHAIDLGMVWDSVPSSDLTSPRPVPVLGSPRRTKSVV